MLNDLRPHTGGADAQSFYDESTANLAGDSNPPTGLADRPLSATLTGIPPRTSMEEVAKPASETEPRLERVWHLLNDGDFIALKKSSVAGQRAAYWMVLLTLFTDMKATELASLSPGNFAWTSCAGHLVRQPASKWGRGQLHPVHDLLIQCGFLEFIAERWAAKAVYLLSDTTKAEPSPRAARRYVARAWAHSTPAPSWGDFRAARRSEATKVLCTHPDLQSRLDASCQYGLHPVEEMQLVLDLEQAFQFDNVNWGHHRSVGPTRFEGSTA